MASIRDSPTLTVSLAPRLGSSQRYGKQAEHSVFRFLWASKNTDWRQGQELGGSLLQDEGPHLRRSLGFLAERGIVEFLMTCLMGKLNLKEEWEGILFV